MTHIRFLSAESYPNLRDLRVFLTASNYAEPQNPSEPEITEKTVFNRHKIICYRNSNEKATLYFKKFSKPGNPALLDQARASDVGFGQQAAHFCAINVRGQLAACCLCL